MKTFGARLFSALLWAAAGALALYILLPEQRPELIPHIITHTEFLEAREPDTVRTFVDRIVYRTPEPEQVATAPGGGEADVAAFCSEAVARGLQEARPVTVDEPLPRAQPVTPGKAHLFLRSIRHDEGWWIQKDLVALTGPLSTGDLTEWTFSARRSWSARAHADSLIFRRPRWDWIQDAAELVIPLAAGLALGKIF